MVAGVGVGIFESYEKAASLARARSTHPVNTQWNAAYRKYYPLYAQIYERLRPINDAIAGVRIGEKP